MDAIVSYGLLWSGTGDAEVGRTLVRHPAFRLRTRSRAAELILDYDKNGNLVGLEILDASKRVGDPMSVEYAIARP